MMRSLCLLSVVWFGVTELAAQQISVSRSGGDQEGNRQAQDREGRPYIVYGNSRRSSTWASVDGGPRVAIDDGIEWEGNSYFISITGQLLARSEDEGNWIWSQPVSAFWNRMGIESFAAEDEEPILALALRSTQHEDYVEYRSLETGTRIGGTTAESPGSPVRIERSWVGAVGASDEPWHGLIESDDKWQEVHDRLFRDVDDAPPRDLDIDFAKECLVVIYGGKGSNCRGFSGSLFETEEGWLMRVTAHTYQSSDRTPATWPWGVMVVPHREGAVLTTQRNRQRIIRGPAMWQDWHRWEMKGEGL